ncbi:hypothetical protein DTL42_06000 [Bremerella cremea]|uniref:Uncharacterized protein n=1 Tax=Bremerella cremea TaxID=1031537 RepID=A0A368KWE5_9BACT|nr:hypothetical protein DTL42_06000 [Bremerella cremea]
MTYDSVFEGATSSLDLFMACSVYPKVGVSAGSTCFIYFHKMLIQLNLAGFMVFWWQHLQPGNRIRVQTGPQSLRGCEYFGYGIVF